jgi:hypothetical protein
MLIQFLFKTQEIPAARLRALNMGMATASQWLFNFVVAKCTPLMFATLGPRGYGTYFLYGSFCFLMVVYAWFLVPETKGESPHNPASDVTELTSVPSQDFRSRRSTSCLIKSPFDPVGQSLRMASPAAMVGWRGKSPRLYT